MRVWYALNAACDVETLWKEPWESECAASLRIVITEQLEKLSSKTGGMQKALRPEAPGVGAIPCVAQGAQVCGVRAAPLAITGSHPHPSMEGKS